MGEKLNVGFIGNPNCGKTTLFNAYTGARLKVANWPGVTIEKKEGAMKYHDHQFKLVDLPGIYSLTSYTMEEKVSRQYILEDEVDVIVDIADASSLERNLYLTLQLLELGKPVILALNMMDVVEERGMEIDLHRLPEMLGIPCIPVSARKKTGLEILMHTVAHHRRKIKQCQLEHHHRAEDDNQQSGQQNYQLQDSPQSNQQNCQLQDRPQSNQQNCQSQDRPQSNQQNCQSQDDSQSGQQNYQKQEDLQSGQQNYQKQEDSLRNKHEQYAMVYSDKIEEKIDIITERLIEKYGNITNPRWISLKLLEKDSEIVEKYPLELEDVVDRSYETDIINEKYDFIEEIIEEVLVNKESKAERTDKIDAVLTHRIWGVPVFLGIMAMVFMLTFLVGDFLKGGLEILVERFSTGVEQCLVYLHASDMVISLLIDGIIAGVGGIISFLPNIIILFIALAILEDSGYMSRVAYVMDGIMGKMGLSGRAFLPMILGFGCTVPAVMASRALEDERDRRRTIFVTPFMSCSARLPIYIIFSEMFFGKYAVFAAFSMYVIGIFVALAVAYISGKLAKSKEINTLLIELPEYKVPNARTVFIYVWEKVKDYLGKAGTTIFVASVIIWGILNFGPGGMATEVEDSFGAMIGKILVPILAPAGLGFWEIAVALISGLAAKEVVVSSAAVLFSVGNINSSEGMHAMTAALTQIGFGPVNAYALMLFCLLYTPCVATIATMKKELNSVKMTAAYLVFQLGLAWAVTTVFYQVAQMIVR